MAFNPQVGSSALNTPATMTPDNASLKSKDDDDRSVAEEGIEDAFQSPHSNDEEAHHPQPVTEKADPNIVGWDGPNDPENPMNWSKAKKWWITILTGLMTFVVSFGSSVFSTATQVTAKQFGVGNEVMILGVSLYVVGFACGPLVFGPLSEVYGRRMPLLIGFFAFLIFQIPVGVATNLETIFICRFLAGAFGSAPLAIVAGMYVDFWDNSTRGIATLVYAGAVFAGPTAGPIIGEFTVKNTNLGWHWTAWFTMIMGAFFFVLAVPTVPESLAPIILKNKAARLRFETRNWALHSKLEEEPVQLKNIVMKYGLKPVLMITQEPILIIMTLYLSLVYGILYLIFFAFPFSFEFNRGWDFGVASLPFIAIFIGVVLACALMALETKLIYQPKFIKSGKLIPEDRLPPMMFGSVILVIGLFWFAWTSSKNVSWVPQVISGIFIGCGIIATFMPGMVYIVDVYLFEANSALAANACVRSFVAAGFPLFATSMYQRLGQQWATSLLAFLCLALVPFPFLFYIYGKEIRSWSRFAYDFG